MNQSKIQLPLPCSECLSLYIFQLLKNKSSISPKQIEKQLENEYSVLEKKRSDNLKDETEIYLDPTKKNIDKDIYDATTEFYQFIGLIEPKNKSIMNWKFPLPTERKCCQKENEAVQKILRFILFFQIFSYS